VNVLNKQSQTADKGCSSSLEVGRGANNYSLENMLRNIYNSFGHVAYGLWNDVSNTKDASGMWVYGLERAGLENEKVFDTCECGYEPSVSIKVG
jgi:hypothetical protein